MGVSLLPELILQRRGYDVAVRPIAPELLRHIGVAYRDRRLLPLAARAFIEYLVECHAEGFFVP